MSFLAYYFHWSREEVMNLPHMERRRWCRRVTDINDKISGKYDDDPIGSFFRSHQDD